MNDLNCTRHHENKGNLVEGRRVCHGINALQMRYPIGAASKLQLIAQSVRLWL